MDKFQNRYRIPSARWPNWDYGNNGAYFITICTAHREYFFGDIIPLKNELPEIDASPEIASEFGASSPVQTRLIASLSPALGEISGNAGEIPGNANAIPFNTAPAQIMQLSEIGQLAEKYWMEIPDHFPFAKLDEFKIMPNHMHGIIIINNDENNGINAANQMNGADGANNANDSNGAKGTDAINRVSIASQCPSPSPSQCHLQSPSLPLSQSGGITHQHNPMLYDNLSRVIRWYKGRTTFESRKIHADFAWQSRFHDHVIRNEMEYYRIANYIINNPANWQTDKFNKP